MIFEGDEAWRIRRARVALLLRVPPSVVDGMPEGDIDDVLAIDGAIGEVRGELMKRARVGRK